MSLPIVVINSHPVQYFAPLYKFCTERGLPIEVWYCSDESIKGKMDAEFNSNVKWDIPLLEGYSSRFFRNFSWKPSIYNGFFGLVNLGLVKALFSREKSIIIIHGWNYFSSILSLIVGRLAGHRVAIRSESPCNQEVRKTSFNKTLKKFILGAFLFKLVDKFLFIGRQNRLFYEFYGVPLKKMVYAPYCVDNERFQSEKRRLSKERTKKRHSLGYSDNTFVVLFSGKFIYKKRPLTLLRAFQRVQLTDKALIMMGDGELRSEMETFITDRKVRNVFLTGFVNQSMVSEYYSIADVFVMCSGDGETWGLSVNEAMNFDLPLVVTDIVGCSDDLVRVGNNGCLFSLDDEEELARRIENMMRMSHESRIQMGLESGRIIDEYRYERVADGFKTAAVE